jgi:hypothetical protein
VAFDLTNRDVPKKQAYAALAAMVAELLDGRCAGIYVASAELEAGSRMGKRRSIVEFG